SAEFFRARLAKVVRPRSHEISSRTKDRSDDHDRILNPLIYWARPESLAEVFKSLRQGGRLELARHPIDFIERRFLGRIRRKFQQVETTHKPGIGVHLQPC